MFNIEPTFEWSSIQINHNTISAKHTDRNNMGPSYTFTLGDSSGGDLIVPSAGIRGVKPGTLIKFDGTKIHWSTPFKGERFSVVVFCHDQVVDINAEEYAYLRSLGFRLPCGAQATPAIPHLFKRSALGAPIGRPLSIQLFASFGYEATAQDDIKKKFFGVSVDERPTYTVGLKMGVNGAYVSDLYEDKLLLSHPTLETSLGRGIKAFNGAIRDRTPAPFVWSTIQVIGITAAPYAHKTDKQRISLGLPADVPLVLTVIGGNADQHVIRVGRNGGASLRLKATELLLTYGDVTYGGTANFAASDVSHQIGGKYMVRCRA